jgi:cytidyltransferase-like protein
MIIYTDGIFDLFHRGHIEFLNNIKKKYKKCTLIVGIINDKDSINYKRIPIYNENDRYIITENIKCVDKIIKNAPLIINEEFILKNKIDLIVHGFLNEEDIIKQKDFFEIPIKLNIFESMPYYKYISTSNIIKEIKNNY